METSGQASGERVSLGFGRNSAWILTGLDVKILEQE